MESRTGAAAGLVIPPPNMTFSKFPAELRIKIMGLVAPGPRRIEVVWDDEKEVWTTTAMPPINLSISSEWRIEILKKCTLAFGTADSPARIPIDFSRDQISILEDFPPGLFAHKDFTPTHFDKIQKLRIDQDFLDDHLDVIVALDEVKSIAVVAECGLHGVDWGAMSGSVRIYNMMIASRGAVAHKLGMEKLLGAFRKKLRMRHARHITKQQEDNGEVDVIVVELIDQLTRSMPTLSAEKISANGSKCTRCLESIAKAKLDCAERVARGEALKDYEERGLFFAMKADDDDDEYEN